MTNQILQSIKSIVSLNENEEEAFTKILEVKEFKKRRFSYNRGRFAIKFLLSIRAA